MNTQFAHLLQMQNRLEVAFDVPAAEPWTGSFRPPSLCFQHSRRPPTAGRRSLIDSGIDGNLSNAQLTSHLQLPSQLIQLTINAPGPNHPPPVYPLIFSLTSTPTWTPSVDQVFQNLEDQFTTAPTWIQVDPACQFVVEVDASDVGVVQGTTDNQELKTYLWRI
ncbi:hypothetical protein GJAV_G00184710 [Gymnothorax javanicus]|nr:hypothetical protein GJAV_G00184710 [Gymnothorax javanicus]